MILTEEYFEARSEAMKWLAQKPDKRNFAAGLRILVKSGYKPNVQKLLQKKGELPWTMEKLTSFSAMNNAQRAAVRKTGPSLSF